MVDFQNLDLLIVEEIQNAYLLIFRPIENQLAETYMHHGGPFTTEQVENVKTLLRILLFLVAMGPVFVLQLPASQYILPLFSFHVGTTAWSHFTVVNCSALKLENRVVETGGLTALFTNILFPIYIWVVFLVLRHKLLKIFTRLGIGIIFYFLGVLSMLNIDG